MIGEYADAIVESIREGLVVLDDDLQIHFANAAFCRMFRVDGAMSPGLGLLDVADGGIDGPGLRKLLHGLVDRRENIEDFELSFGPTWAERTLLVSGRVLEDPAAGSPTFLLIVEDITRRRTAELTLDRQRAELARSNEDLEQFAAAASHDLREPLRKIQTFGSRLATKYGSVLDEEGAGYVGRMVESSARLQQLISDQLHYAQIAVRTPEPSPTRLGDIVAEVMTELELRVQEAGARITLSELPVARVDPELFRHVFLNLIANALKFTRPGVPPDIRIYTAAEPVLGSGPTIVIEDNGIGIEARHSERIFRPFQRLHGRAQFEGSGMGLAIVRRIVERHGGSVSVASVLGEGTRFKITLPLSSTVGIGQ